MTVAKAGLLDEPPLLSANGGPLSVRRHIVVSCLLDPAPGLEGRFHLVSVEFRPALSAHADASGSTNRIKNKATPNVVASTDGVSSM